MAIPLAAFVAPHEPTHVLRRADTFAVVDRYGDMRPGGMDGQGLYHQGTRYLSCLLTELDGSRPVLLVSTLHADDDQLDVQCTNAEAGGDGARQMPLGRLHLALSTFVRQGVYYQRLWLKNLGVVPVESLLSIHFEADFADVMGLHDPHYPRGRHLPPLATDQCVILGYRGLDGETRQTLVQFDPPPRELTGSTALIRVSLQPQQATACYVTVKCAGASPLPVVGFDQARADGRRAAAGECEIEASDARVGAWIRRGRADLRMLTTDLATGPYPYAGLPYFNTVFGRDGLIAALESLWLQPQLARGVLLHLAANQATEIRPEQDAEPGKILHEVRGGELAMIGAVPFARYYGSVDATPLFVLLAGAYYERTGDLAFARSIWENVERSLDWIDDYGDADGDGLIEYHRHSPRGLVHQGSKDSDGAVFHADGSPAVGPIALCEAQAYVYAARIAAGALASALGDHGRAAELAQRAESLRTRFERAFWSEELSTYALALDGQKRPCLVRTSNAGHCLYAGIASPERARRVADTLLHPVSFSGWGVRTLAASECGYNPLGYHTGAVWPHDNALLALGLARYGLHAEALHIGDALCGAAMHFDRQRMPELFCGFPREAECGPAGPPARLCAAGVVGGRRS